MKTNIKMENILLEFIDTPNSNLKELLGIGTGTLKRDAQEQAASRALETLALKHNIIKEAPDRFKAFM